jgi:hypothetical protein
VAIAFCPMASTGVLPTAIPFRQSPGYKGHEVLALNAALIVLTTVIMGARMYVRAFMAKGLGLDDLFAVLSYVGAQLLNVIMGKTVSDPRQGCVIALSASEIRCKFHQKM